MLYAYVNGVKKRAGWHEEGLCPYNHTMRSKCGDIVTWHWAHVDGEFCDPWKGSETKWHLDWKGLFPKEWAEKIITKEVSAEMSESEKAGLPSECNGKILYDQTHIADIQTPNGTSVEFQHSSISRNEIQERNSFYGPKMIWVFDLRSSVENFTFYTQDYGHAFRWRHPKKSLWKSRENVRAVLFDFGEDEMFILNKVYPKIPCGGYGKFISKEEFIETVMKS